MARSQPDPPGGPPCPTSPRPKAPTTPPRSSAAPTTAPSASSASSGTGTRGTFEQLRTCNGDKNCIQAFIEANHPHLLQAYDGGSLATAIDSVRRRLSEAVPH